MPLILEMLPITRVGYFAHASIEAVSQVQLRAARVAAEAIEPPGAMIATMGQSPTSLAGTMEALLPMNDDERHTRLAVVPTCLRGWCVVWTNSGDTRVATSRARMLSKAIASQVVMYSCQPHTLRKGGGYMGDFRLIVHDKGVMTRLVGLHYDGVWRFEQEGKPFPFENKAIYKSRLTKDRFNSRELLRLLAHQGFRPFDDDFYCPAAKQPAAIVEIKGDRRKIVPSQRQYFKDISIDNLRKKWGPYDPADFVTPEVAGA